jgi:hypothetical protein
MRRGCGSQEQPRCERARCTSPPRRGYQTLHVVVLGGLKRRFFTAFGALTRPSRSMLLCWFGVVAQVPIGADGNKLEAGRPSLTRVMAEIPAS